MSSRPLLVINGYDFGAGRYYGINRNAMEVTMAVDRIAGRGVCAFDVEVAVPSVTEHTPAYENVTVKALGRGFGSFRDKVTWRQVWFPRFVAREGGLGCIGTQAGPPGSGRRLRPLLSAAAIVLRASGRRLRHGTCRDCR